MNDIVEIVKERNPIEEVITEEEPLQGKRGRYVRAQRHDSLVVDTKAQLYNWNSRHESGDVINWIQNRQGVDFKTAVEMLCRRCGLPDPEWGRGSAEERIAARKREDVFEIGRRVFCERLFEDGGALEYCHERGWSDETLRLASVGYADGAAAVALRGELSMFAVDLESREAVALIGFKGDVRGWGKSQGVEVQENWVEWGIVPGLAGPKRRITYPHIYGGRVRTFSSRNILGSEINQEGRVIKGFNLPVALAGSRHAFFNHVYRARDDEVVLVEGQADAITLGQWGWSAIALAGTSWKDHQGLLEEVKRRHKTIYIGVDGDEAGETALTGRDGEWPLAEVLGGMARVVQWSVISDQ